MVHSSYIYIYIKGNVKVSNQTWAFKKTKEKKKKKKKVGTKKVSNGEFCGFTLVIEQIKVLLLKTYWLFIYRKFKQNPNTSQFEPRWYKAI